MFPAPYTPPSTLKDMRNARRQSVEIPPYPPAYPPHASSSTPKPNPSPSLYNSRSLSFSSNVSIASGSVGGNGRLGTPVERFASGGVVGSGEEEVEEKERGRKAGGWRARWKGKGKEKAEEQDSRPLRIASSASLQSQFEPTIIVDHPPPSPSRRSLNERKERPLPPLPPPESEGSYSTQSTISFAATPSTSSLEQSASGHSSKYISRENLSIPRASPWYPHPQDSARRKSEDLPSLRMNITPPGSSHAAPEDGQDPISRRKRDLLTIQMPVDPWTSHSANADRKHKRRSATLSSISPPTPFHEPEFRPAWHPEQETSSPRSSQSSSNPSTSDRSKKSRKEKIANFLFPIPSSDLMLNPNPSPVVPKRMVDAKKAQSRPSSLDWGSGPNRNSFVASPQTIPLTPDKTALPSLNTAIPQDASMQSGLLSAMTPSAPSRSSTLLSLLPFRATSSDPSSQIPSAETGPALLALTTPRANPELVDPPPITERPRKTSASFGFLKRVRSFRVDREQQVQSTQNVEKESRRSEEPLQIQDSSDEKMLNKKKSGLGLNIAFFGKKVASPALPDQYTSDAIPPFEGDALAGSPRHSLTVPSLSTVALHASPLELSFSQFGKDSTEAQLIRTKSNSFDIAIRPSLPEIPPKSSQRKSLSFASSPKEDPIRSLHPLTALTSHLPTSTSSPSLHDVQGGSTPPPTLGRSATRMGEDGRKRRSNSVVLLSEFGKVGERDFGSLFDSRGKGKRSRTNSPAVNGSSPRQGTNFSSVTNSPTVTAGLTTIVGSIIGFNHGKANSSSTSLHEDLVPPSHPDPASTRTPPRPPPIKRPSTAGPEPRMRSKSGPFGPFAAIRNSTFFSGNNAPMFPRPAETEQPLDHLAVPNASTSTPPIDNGISVPPADLPRSRSSTSSDAMLQSALPPNPDIEAKRSASPIQLMRKTSQKIRASTFTTSDPPHPPPLAKLPAPIPIETDETPVSYIARLQITVSKMEVASILSSSTDPFHLEALQTYMNLFDFCALPLDMAIRKLLLESRLPRETQQIDRVMEAFAKSYVEANPTLFSSQDHAYILAFSLIMLHTDAFNKSNKNKMTKADYVRNLSKSVDGLGKEVLEYFFDNITATPFVYGEDDIDIHGEPSVGTGPQSPFIGSTNMSSVTSKDRPKSDLYYMLAHEPMLLHELRADVQSIIPPKNPFSYTGTNPFFNASDLHAAFSRAYIVPVAVSPQETIPLNLGDYIQPDLNLIGSFSNLKVAKAGILSRKEDLVEGGKKSTSRKWKAWGVILTGSQLLFFKDSSWVEEVVSQIRVSDSSFGHTEFAPVSGLTPDAVLSLADSLALYDASYERHPNTFRLITNNGRQFLFQADNVEEMNDWLAFINYAASFKTAGVRMRDMSNTNFQRPMFPSEYLVDFPKSSMSPSEDSTRALMDAQPSPTPTRSFTHIFPSDQPESDNLVYQRSVSSDFPAIPPEWGPRLLSRSEILRKKISDFDNEIVLIRASLQADLRQVRNLDILMPLLKTTRDKIRALLPALEKKIRHGRIELSRVHCYREVLMKDLMAEERELNKYRHYRAASIARARSKLHSRHSSATFSFQSSTVEPEDSPQAPFMSQEEDQYASDDENERRRLSITPTNLKRRNTGDLRDVHSDSKRLLKLTVSATPTSSSFRSRLPSHDLPAFNSPLQSPVAFSARLPTEKSSFVAGTLSSDITVGSTSAQRSEQSETLDLDLNIRKLAKIREERGSEMLRAGIDDTARA
ncbi:hypothetical protein BT69DRAFT_1351581 [Atractiella rhizophila]|nr:hypothetical protein BT69DRAFT_1351581 [Atractiella rhizophila]